MADTYTMRKHLAIACALALAVSACKQQDADASVIGEYRSLTGATATFGQSTHKGVTMAVSAINASGGVLGKKLRVVTEDDQGKPEEAMTAVTKLINKDRVVAVLGEIASSN